MADTPKKDPPAAEPSMEEKILALQAELEATKSALQQSEQAQADILRQVANIPVSQEVYAGKAVKKIVDKDGNESEEEVDIFAITINLPPSGGPYIKINDFPLYNNHTYKLERDTIRTVKDMMFRSWWHENNVAGDEREVAYRPQGVFTVGAGGVRRSI